jgi:hypothetical protein
LKKNQIQAYDENERKKEMKEKLRENTKKDVTEGKKPHYVNKSKSGSSHIKLES